MNNNWFVDGNSSATISTPYKIFNIGNDNPVKRLGFIQSLDNSLAVTVNKNFLRCRRVMFIKLMLILMIYFRSLKTNHQ